jgi:hypothetical protein
MPTVVSLALRSAAARRALRTPGPVWFASRRSVRELVPDAESWYRADELDGPWRRPWEGWSYYPAESRMSPVAYLEQQAQRIPPDWTIIGLDPNDPVPSAPAAAQDAGMTHSQVLAYLNTRGRKITASTWRSYVARGQAPAPSRHVERTPLWDLVQVEQWAERPEK